VGQDELEIARAAHTTLVVVAPGLGDDVQAMKAGLAECADVFAVNKADKPGADAAVADLVQMLALASDASLTPALGHHGSAAALLPETPVTPVSWMPPVVRCVATRGEGIDELTDALGAHRAWLENTEPGRARELVRTRLRLTTVLRDAVAEAAVARLAGAVGDAAERIQRGELDIDTALDELVALLAAPP
jgi:LAO/AO transport system kinase